MSLEVTRVLHAGYIIKSENAQIIFDPIFENPFSQNCYAFPNVSFDNDRIRLQKWDAVFISHYHEDHCSLVSLNLIDKETPIYLYCQHGELYSMIMALGFKNVNSLALDKTITVGDIEIKAHRAWDSDVDCLFQIKQQGLNVLNVVDSLIDDDKMTELSSSGPWDLVLWPFQTMLETDVLSPSRRVQPDRNVPQEFLAQLKVLNAKYIIPSSCQFVQEAWSWYNYAMFPISYRVFREQVEKMCLESSVFRLNPGQSIELSKNQLGKTVLLYKEPLEWLCPIGNQDVDYEFDFNRPISRLGEISKNFPGLSLEQQRLVWEFLKTGLIDRFNSLDSSPERYFGQSFVWKLVTYDHLGQSNEFYYQFENFRIKSFLGEQVEDSQLQVKDKFFNIGWLTEAPLAKIYGALENGESLTSMYLRINDADLGQAVERQINDVDVLQDPLVRTLFTGVFGAFQRHQLTKIMNQ